MVDIKPFVQVFERIARSRSESELFSDFLDISICCLSGQRYEEQYLSIIKKYKKEEVEALTDLFAQMVIIMEGDGKGLTDCLGEFFMMKLSHGVKGQFFTPQHICDFMAAVTLDETSAGQTIMDPCCGSGRMLLSVAKISRHNYFFGADLDYTCCRMAAINLCLNDLIGEVAHMNSLSMEHWGGYRVIRDSKRMNAPTIVKLEPGTGYIYGKGMRKQTEDKIAAPITISQTKLSFE